MVHAVVSLIRYSARPYNLGELNAGVILRLKALPQCYRQ
jgi:hypothetical protein